ncbi:MAG: hypothetical protein ACI841_002441 [Planctomycetota bacterium]|jgi:hypothetical protein
MVSRVDRRRFESEWNQSQFQALGLSGLDPGCDVIVELELEDTRTTMRGTVRQVGDGSYWLFFPKVREWKGPLSDGYLNIMRRVEQLWLQSRSQETIE